MKRMMLSLLMITVLTLSPQAQQTLNGVTLPATLAVGQSDLSLNGAGIRTKLVFKLYTAGLYLSAESSDAYKIVSADDAMAVRLVITSNKINSGNMSEAINEGFSKSTGDKTEPIRSRINKMLKTFTSEGINPGDVFDITYTPGTGVLTYKNGNLKSTIKGLDFKQALFGIWLSDDPVSSGLKKGMLGL